MTSLWTDYLARSGASLAANSLSFDTPPPVPGETLVVPLLHLGVIRSAGEDSAAFLHNLFSNDVKKLASDEAQWNSFNSPKGRMLASMLLWSEDGGHALALASDILVPMHKKLSMYVLRSKVKLTDASGDTALIGLAGPNAEAIANALGLPAATGDMRQSSTDALRGIRLNATTYVLAVALDRAESVFEQALSAGGIRAGTDAWQLAMIRAGLPLITAATQEEFVAQMLNYELIGGVNFKKGCYPGQEIVARTQYLGKLKKRMYRVRIDAEQAPAAGTDLYTPAFGEQSAGKLVNVAPSPDGGFEALAVMQISCADTGEIHLGSPTGTLLVLLDLPYSVD